MYQLALNSINYVGRTILCLVFLLGLCNSVGFSQDINLRAYRGIANVCSPLTPDPIVLLRPGKFIDPAYEHSNSDNAYADALEFNRIIKPSIIYSETPNDLGSLYSRILTQEQWAVLPLLPTQAAEREKLRSTLFRTDGSPRPGYKLYLEKKQVWEKVNEIYENTPPDQRTPELEAQHQQALDQFEVLRSVYGTSDSRLQQLNEQASLGWRDADIQNLTKFASGSSDGKSYLTTGVLPELERLDELDWTRINLSSSQVLQTESPSKFVTGIDANALRWWYWSTATDVDTHVCQTGLDNADFKIEFEVAVATIGRDWLDTRVFESQAWRWKSGSTELLSDGQDDQNQGSSPLFPHSIVLVRSLVISGPSVGPCLSAVRKAVANQHEIGFGPFRLAGPAMSHSSLYLPPLITRTAIHVFYPQILGYGVTVLPKTPNPNPGYVWPNN